jgi:hypothetical protein
VLKWAPVTTTKRTLLAVFCALALLAGHACFLNPQPEPPNGSSSYSGGGEMVGPRSDAGGLSYSDASRTPGVGVEAGVDAGLAQDAAPSPQESGPSDAAVDGSSVPTMGVSADDGAPSGI